MINLSGADFVVNTGERIGQMVNHKVEQVSLIKVDSLGGSGRVAGGFGYKGNN
jgi:dUTPase